MLRDKFADVIDEDGNLVLETLESGGAIVCPFDTSMELLNDPPTQKWHEYRDRFIAEGRLPQ